MKQDTKLSGCPLPSHRDGCVGRCVGMCAFAPAAKDLLRKEGNKEAGSS